ncbi:nucleoid-structuring protein H-NS [Marivirga lumbricoides]|nr:nucleoid-structuring protein H-NS [Marivirga lumbricoides]
MALILSAGLFACKGSKKAADASKDSDQDKPVVVIKDDQPEITEPVERDTNTREDAKMRLDNYFNSIANASGNATAANRNINEAKALFASGDVPVFIVIHQSTDGTKDYDEPTTIKDYLNYLKDTGKNLNNIAAVKTNSSGKITELELIRK